MRPGHGSSRLLWTLSVTGALLLAACAHTLNYPDPSGPRYAGRSPRSVSFRAEAAGAAPELRLVTFNIKFGRRTDRALELLSADPNLGGADLIFLQEMDAAGTQDLARGLGLNFVYYPAAVHPTDHRDMGEAILSPWPILADRKIVLPHLGWFRRSLRIAVRAVVLVRGSPVAAYGVHLATPFELDDRERRDQVETILRAARQDTGRVVIAGDLNSHGLGDIIRDAGFAWPTEHLHRTLSLFDIDHVFLRGFEGTVCAGVVRNNLGASDHHPVWVEIAPAEPEE